MALSQDLVQDETLAELGARYGMSAEQARAVAEVVGPEFSLKLEQRALSRGGLAQLVALLGAAEDARQNEKTTPDALEKLGQPVMEEVYGGQDKTLFLTSRAAKAAGAPTENVEAMMPALNALAAQRLAARTQPQFNRLFETIPAGRTSNTLPQQQPLPVPGGNPNTYGRTTNRYEDLSDVLKRQRTPSPGGGTLGRSIRDILGTGLGNRSSGIMSWIIRLIIARYGWTIVKWLFGRMFARR